MSIENVFVLYVANLDDDCLKKSQVSILGVFASHDDATKALFQYGEKRKCVRDCNIDHQGYGGCECECTCGADEYEDNNFWECYSDDDRCMWMAIVKLPFGDFPFESHDDYNENVDVTYLKK